VSNTAHGEVASRIELVWEQPDRDVNNFVTDSCGADNTPAVASNYRVYFDTKPDLSTASSYDIRMLQEADTSDDTALECCPGSCTIELGAEVQTVSVKSNSDGPITQGSFKVVYVGSQSQLTTVTPTTGSTNIVTSSNSASGLAAGDYIRINGDVYLVTGIPTDTSATLKVAYQGSGSGVAVEANFNTPPTTCIDFDATGAEFKDHVEGSFNDAPFDESITVTKDTVIAGMQHDYRVTFVGAGFGFATEELFTVYELDQDLFPSAPDASCLSWQINNIASSSPSVRASTDIDAGVFVPGTTYYVAVAAINAAGEGVKSDTLTVVPKSPPGLAQNVRVYSIFDDDSGLRITWDPADNDYGAPVTGYDIVYTFQADNGYTSGSNGVKTITVAEATAAKASDGSAFSYDLTSATGLLKGNSYNIQVRPLNSQSTGSNQVLGEGAPLWYKTANNNNGGGYLQSTLSSVPVYFSDFTSGSTYAFPTCDGSHSDCAESSTASRIVRVRANPDEPSQFTAATYPDVINRIDAFSDTSITVNFGAPVADSGESPDKYMIEWDTEANIGSGPNYGSHVESTEMSYKITGLVMGQTYYVRVTAHNSAG
jgi:hypothetical protein